MKYFKNTELAKLYKVSEKSVRNWIESTKLGKLDFVLYEDGGKPYIANTTKNTALVEKLVEKGKKFKNTRGAKKLTPKRDFYKFYSQKQILDIIANLTIHRETPLQYTYVNGGAADWDAFANRLSNERTPNILNQTLNLLESTSDKIEGLLATYKKVNVVDIGPGNGLPIRPTLERLVKQGRLNRYIPIDISKDMISILQQNIAKWFGDTVKVDPYFCDVSYERFNDITLDDFAKETANLVFFLGGTLANFRLPGQVLQVINNSLGPDDIFIYSGYLDTPETRRYFDYYPTPDNPVRKVPIQDGLILDFLNIDESLYDVEQIFNEEKRARTISIRPKVDLSIGFELPAGTRHVELRKGEPILIWRHWHNNVLGIIEQLDQNGFDIMQATKSPDGYYLLITSKIKTGIDV